jgi:hypothetical protein
MYKYLCWTLAVLPYQYRDSYATLKLDLAHVHAGQSISCAVKNS